jgi:hypothetical protein
VVFRRLGSMVKGNGHCQRAPLQINKVFTNGRLLRWPPFARGSSYGSWLGFATLLACEGPYRALARGATIPEDRPVRPDSERRYAGRSPANTTNSLWDRRRGPPRIRPHRGNRGTRRSAAFPSPGQPARGGAQGVNPQHLQRIHAHCSLRILLSRRM